MHELRIELRDGYNTNRYAYYNKFVVGSEEDYFPMIALGWYNGTAGDSLKIHAGMKFSTFDSDHDSANTQCARENHGAWWYNDCFDA